MKKKKKSHHLATAKKDLIVLSMLIWNTTDQAFSKRKKQEKLLSQLQDLQRKPLIIKKGKFDQGFVHRIFKKSSYDLKPFYSDLIQISSNFCLKPVLLVKFVIKSINSIWSHSVTDQICQTMCDTQIVKGKLWQATCDRHNWHGHWRTCSFLQIDGSILIF